MSALRLPQHLAEAPHIDSGEARLKFELLEERDGSASSALHLADKALAALRAHDAAARGAEGRAPLLDAAVAAVWRVLVQHEACDCHDAEQLMARHRIPPEVMARLGAIRRPS